MTVRNFSPNFIPPVTKIIAVFKFLRDIDIEIKLSAFQPYMILIKTISARRDILIFVNACAAKVILKHTAIK